MVIRKRKMSSRARRARIIFCAISALAVISFGMLIFQLLKMVELFLGRGI